MSWYLLLTILLQLLAQFNHFLELVSIEMLQLTPAALELVSALVVTSLVLVSDIVELLLKLRQLRLSKSHTSILNTVMAIHSCLVKALFLNIFFEYRPSMYSRFRRLRPEDLSEDSDLSV